jgi:hypothetical protein
MAGRLDFTDVLDALLDIEQGLARLGIAQGVSESAW